MDAVDNSVSYRSNAIMVFLSEAIIAAAAMVVVCLCELRFCCVAV